MRTLIVEDEPLTRLCHELSIQSMGFEYTSCEDAATALEAYRHTFYSLVMTDLGLPDMHGVEFCRRLRALPNGDRSIILVVSGSDTPKDIQAAYEAGANEFFSKPVDPERLRERVAMYHHQQRAPAITSEEMK